MKVKMCLNCSREFVPKRKEQIYCSRSCASVSKGKKSSQWMSTKKNAFKTGRLVTEDGYIKVQCGNHPWLRKNHYMSEHVKVMEEYIGRRIRPNEVVHHKDGNKTNNEILNLVLLTRREHHRLHSRINDALAHSLIATIRNNYETIDDWVHTFDKSFQAELLEVLPLLQRMGGLK